MTTLIMAAKETTCLIQLKVLFSSLVMIVSECTAAS